MPEEMVSISREEYNDLQDAYIRYKLFRGAIESSERDAVELVELRAKYQDLLHKVQDFEDDFKKVMREECAPDEQHCSCVPHLRTEIKYLKSKSTLN